jgi:hypothetical protein
MTAHLFICETNLRKTANFRKPQIINIKKKNIENKLINHELWFFISKFYKEKAKRCLVSVIYPFAIPPLILRWST